MKDTVKDSARKAKCFVCQRILGKGDAVITSKNKFYCFTCGESVRQKRIERLEFLISKVKGEQ